MGGGGGIDLADMLTLFLSRGQIMPHLITTPLGLSDLPTALNYIQSMS